jgi:FKBP-type peptidyl-prolyl cis-trans isomerase FklB
MNEIEAQEVLRQLQRALPAKLAAENKAKGEAFLAKNGKVPGVTTLPNGIQYKVLKEGSGAMPKTNDSVIVSYKGSLIDGTVFDQNEHFTTPVTGRTIKGWSEILPLMKTGAKWEVTIPSDLAYGMRAPPKIGPNAVLVFDMELLSISEPPSAPKPAPAPASPPHAALVNPPPFTPGGPPAPPGATTPVVSGQIIKVPSAEELKKGAKIEVITNVPNQ